MKKPKIKPSVDTEVSMWNRGHNVGRIETIAEVEKLIDEIKWTPGFRKELKQKLGELQNHSQQDNSNLVCVANKPDSIIFDKTADPRKRKEMKT